MSISFTSPDDLWHGGFFELAIQLGPRSDERLSRAATALWNYPLIEGCFSRRDVELADQPRLSAIDAAQYQIQSGYHIYGIAHKLPDSLSLVCGSLSIREDESGIDWLDFYLPMGAVDPVYEGIYDSLITGLPSPTWLRLEAWFAELGRYLFAHVPFSLGLIGHEVSGMEDAANIAQNGIPDSRYCGYLWPEQDGLSFYPSTK
jgi:hypothetical protein